MLAIVFLSLCFNPATPKTVSTLSCDTIKLPGREHIESDTSKYIEVSRVFIIGNKITRDAIILRELNLKPGDIVSSTELPLLLERDKRKLFNTHLFNTADVRPLQLEPGKIDLLVEVNERWYTFPSPRFDLSDRNFNEWWQNYNHDFRRVIYGLKLFQYNMRGRNETLALTALFGFQRNFGISYRIPYIDQRQKQGLSVDFNYIEAKNLALQTTNHKLEFVKSPDIQRMTRTASVSYNYRNSFYVTHSLTLGYSNSWINDSISLKNPNYFGEGKTRQIYTSLTYQFSSEHRDVIAYPLKGYQVVFQLQKLGLSSKDDINKIETSLSYSKYLDLRKGFYFSNYSIAYGSNPNSIPYSNYSALGYQKQFVRGYEIYVIQGPYAILNKATLKKRILSRNYNWSLMPRAFQHIPLAIYVKTYTDLGYVKNYNYYEQNNYNTSLSNKLLIGAGGGFDIVGSYDLVIRLEYTFNGEDQKGFFFHLKKEF